jgi:myo-inositol-1(or 4)-monophosphatase
MRRSLRMRWYNCMHMETNYLPFLQEQLQAAAHTAQRFFGKVSGTVKPGDNNQVLTEADVAIGQQLVAAIQSAYPDHNIIDEEAGVIDNGSAFTWVVDPIEATSNFAAGLPQYGIMVGLLHDAEPLAGGIIAPAYNKLYLAQKGRGATCNGEPIHVTTEQNLLNTLVSYGIDGHQENPQQTIDECRQLADIVLGIRNLRNSGCEAVDPMYVAEGRYGGRINLSSKIWDNVAPHIITQEAGAMWTDLHGNPADYTNPLARAEQNFTFCVASPVLHGQLQAILHK